MHDRLLVYLRACDRNHYYDLAGQALALAISRSIPRNEKKPTSIAKAYPEGITALQKLEAGYDVTREELRALAELENTLENPVETQKTNSPEREIFQAVVATISGSLPRETQARLARSIGDSGEDLACLLPRKGIPNAGWYTVTATVTFTLVMELSAIPAAIAFGGNAWATALIPLAIVALLVYLLYWKV